MNDTPVKRCAICRRPMTLYVEGEDYCRICLMKARARGPISNPMKQGPRFWWRGRWRGGSE